jgi:hypothetical protein
MGQSKVSQQNQGPYPKDQGGDGVPRQEHCGEGLQAVQVPDRGCHRCYGGFFSKDLILKKTFIIKIFNYNN